MQGLLRVVWSVSAVSLAVWSVSAVSLAVMAVWFVDTAVWLSVTAVSVKAVSSETIVNSIFIAVSAECSSVSAVWLVAVSAVGM